MSGVEIAGLVLGCLPLIIQGIASYKEGLDPVKSFMGWERELPHFIRKLRGQHAHYAQTIEILFAPITSEVELAAMMSDPGASQKLWKSKEIDLQDRLQGTYSSYQSTMADIERIMKKIASRLDLDRAPELTRNDLEAMLAANPKKADDKFEFRKRVRFGMSKKTIKALLEELDECNKELERFTEKSEKIETYRKASKPTYATRLQRLQRYAKTLHESLTVCWQCSCKSSHKTRLQLESRGSVFASGPRKNSDASKTSFNVSFSTLSSDGNCAPWSYQAAEICVEEDDDVCLAPMASPKPKMTKSVSFGTPPAYAVLDPAGRLGPSLSEVKDLCASIQQVHKSASTIGFSLDNKSKLRGAYSIDTSEAYVPPSGLVSLESLLDHPPVVNGRRSKLSKKERYSLALTLASSVLYLNATPWLANEWTVRDILFHRTPNTARPIDIERPYLAPTVIELSQCAAKTKKPKVFKNTVLLALAIALLELYFGTTAEKYQESESEDGIADPSVHQNPWMLCSFAHTWAETETENLSAAFLNAIRHCIHSFSVPGTSLQDAECLQAAVEGIILPLQEELSQFLGTTLM
ncbi:hypothetical protein BDW02DRAFT_585441 [Decorospora gaudefroyi]|uniref:DUF7580 domain-containing protein n=1 Tax=Decorospora gaudefroyi TaxID=184978 RepID=A0A6A5KUK9_9PLEO|nr:hypothetical protein BDW02DRAFT_585441 [Decorospora gaudefroyi]